MSEMSIHNSECNWIVVVAFTENAKYTNSGFLGEMGDPYNNQLSKVQTSRYSLTH